MAVNVSVLTKMAAAAKSREICFQAIFDWDDDGFTLQDSAWYDESDHVVSFRGDMQAVDWRRSLTAVGHAVADVVYVTLNNEKTANGRRFSLTNTAGPLYAKIGEGKIKYMRAIVKMGFMVEDTPYLCHQITGYIVGHKELDNGRLVELEIRDRGADAAQSTVSTELFENVWPKTYIRHVTYGLSRDTLDWPGDYPAGDYGVPNVDLGFYPLQAAWADNENIWQELSDVAEAQMGRVWFDKEGDFHWEDAGHWVRPNVDNWDNPLLVQARITEADYESCLPIYDIRNHYSKIQIEYTPRYVGPLQDVYSNPDVWMVGPGQTETYFASFRHPVQNIQTPILGEDYTVVSAGGVDISADVDVDFEFQGAEAKIDVTNNHLNYAAVIAGMTIRGYPHLPRQAAKYEAEDENAVHKTNWLITNPFIQTRRHAMAVADFALARYQNAIQAVRLINVRGLPWLEVGDRIEISGPQIDNSKDDYFITRIAWSGPVPYVLGSLEAVRVRDIYPLDDYFWVGDQYLDGSRYGMGSGHGHIFW